MRTHRSLKIYHSKKHLGLTLFFVFLPFVFFIFFTRFANVPAGDLFGDFLLSFFRIFVAYFISAILGWLAAILFYRGRGATFALPIFDVLQSFPTFAALPLAVSLWGASDRTVIIFLVITIVWPVFFSVVSSLKLIRRDWEEAVQIYGLSKVSHLVYFLIPVSLPGLITGSIIGLGEGWEALIATEIIMNIRTGLGSFFQFFANNPTVTALGIFGFLLVIFSINKLIWLPLLEWGHRKMEE